ncbi:MAG TPA: hypothetical protein VLY24_00975 [Bryobacteraceae bacterium]|nr:hypothetical protein [Bryobacteraceae bacterium]
MKLSSVFVILFFLTTMAQASEAVDKARQLEKSGDIVGARTALAAAAQQAPADPDALVDYAEFLGRYGDPDCRAAYTKAYNALQKSGDRSKLVEVSRQLIVLDLIAGDRAAASEHLQAFHSAGGNGWTAAPGSKSAPPENETKAVVFVPGPLRSFGRMAAISSDISSDDVLPALARNVVTNGYQASHSNESLEQTEYLKLVHRYLSQARELEKLAGADKVVRVETCDSANAGELLRIIGYRMRGGCGSEVVLETVNATRAFLTTDSGFPLAELEQALRTNRPFAYDFHPAAVTVLNGSDYWLSAKEKESGDFLDAFLGDPSLCRLYLGLSKLDRETADELRKAIPMPRLKAYAHVLDFFGGMFEIRGGKALVPGGARSAAAWAELVGVPPDQGAAFFDRLLAKDDGWMASLFDALARISGPVKDYLTEPGHMKRFYMAVRGRVTSPGPARPVFRSNADMMLLTTRLRIDSNGRPVIPGNIDVWKNLFITHPHGKYDGKLTKAASGWKDPDDVIEALFALCRKSVENEPLKIFMATSDVDRFRARPLEPATIERLAHDYHVYGQQYAMLNDAPSISDKTVLQFLDTAEAISHIKDQLLRADSAGTMQALVGLWQIFCRQSSIPPDQADAALAGILTPFSQIHRDRDIFDAGKNGVLLLVKATGSSDTAAPQDRLLDLLAGTANPTDPDAQAQVVSEMNRILEAQRIVSLNTIFQLDSHLQSLAQGGKLDTTLVGKLASRISEIQLPRSSLTTVEKNSFAFGYWTEKHVDLERKVNLRAAIERAGTDGEKLKDIRGLLAPFLRDTLVAYVYAHYAPPGAQVLYTNPLFVRGHDFIGVQGANHTWRATELFGTGWPSNGGGRLVGSLAGLPYALAEAEQNFLVPEQTQALIWGDLVPQMILSAKIPRWWNVTPAQLHWVGLNIRYARCLMGEAALDPALRKHVVEVLASQAAPARTTLVERLLEEGDVKSALDKVTPAELFIIASVLQPGQTGTNDPIVADIRELRAAHAGEVSEQAVSRAFGTPKPTLTTSYRPELLHLRTFPTLMGYSSRVMAESWESNTLFWVALADELHATPAQLNVLIPEWTQKVVERIFASHLEDWPALLRSLRLVGDDIRAKAKIQPAGEQKAALE